MSPTKLEKETILNFNEEETTANFYTFNVALKKRLFLFAKQHPTLCRLVRQDNNGGVSYDIDKRCLSIRFMQPLSDEQKQKRSECMKRNRQHHKGSDSSPT